MHTGQAGAPVYANYGDGFATDTSLMGSGSTPTAFFTALLQKEYLNQVVIAPHVRPNFPFWFFLGVLHVRCMQAS